MSKKENSIRFTISLTPKMYEIVKRETEKKGISKSAFISIAIENFTNEEKK